MTKIEVTAETLNTLAAKLDGLDLSAEERAVLDATLACAAATFDEPEVVGHGWDEGVAVIVEPGRRFLPGVISGGSSKNGNNIVFKNGDNRIVFKNGDNRL